MSFRLPGPVRRTFRALAPVVCGPEVERLGIGDEVVDGVERFCDALPAHVRAGAIAGALLFEAAPALEPRTLGRTFSRLDPAAAEAVFARWWAGHGPRKQVVKILKMFVAFAYYEHPRVKERLEYHPDRWIAQVARERVTRFAREIEAHEAEVTRPDPLPPGASVRQEVARG